MEKSRIATAEHPAFIDCGIVCISIYSWLMIFIIWKKHVVYVIYNMLHLVVFPQKKKLVEKKTHTQKKNDVY